MEASKTSEQPVDSTQKTQVKLIDAPVTNENEALNVMVSFISLAHKRGAFDIEESAKIWECIKIFKKQN